MPVNSGFGTDFKNKQLKLYIKNFYLTEVDNQKIFFNILTSSPFFVAGKPLGRESRTFASL